jgi:hypothetical protein
MHKFLLLILSSTFFSIFYMFSEFHNLNLKLCSKQYNIIYILHQIVAPQLGGAW